MVASEIESCQPMKAQWTSYIPDSNPQWNVKGGEDAAVILQKGSTLAEVFFQNTCTSWLRDFDSLNLRYEKLNCSPKNSCHFFGSSEVYVAVGGWSQGEGMFRELLIGTQLCVDLCLCTRIPPWTCISRPAATMFIFHQVCLRNLPQVEPCSFEHSNFLQTAYAVRSWGNVTGPRQWNVHSKWCLLWLPGMEVDGIRSLRFLGASFHVSPLVYDSDSNTLQSVHTLCA